MNRKLSVPVVLATALIAVTGSITPAQESGRGGPGGFPSPEESFRRLDRNGNKRIDPDEWESLPPPFRRAFESHADLSRPMELGPFLEASAALRKEMTRRFSGGERDDSRRERGDDSNNSRRGRPPRSDSDEDQHSSGSLDPPESKPAGRISATTAHTARSRTPINVKLPDQYRSCDTDGDGQIGLYEWSRSDYAGFRRLDLNGDGFLTPRELLRGPSASAAPRVETASRVNETSAGERPIATSSPAPAPDTTTSGPPQQNSRAEAAFKLLDRNKDGSISEEEWKKSLNAGPAFAKAGVMVTLPISRTEFFRLYPQAYPNSTKK
jgi:hypothetical protein